MARLSAEQLSKMPLPTLQTATDNALQNYLTTDPSKTTEATAAEKWYNTLADELTKRLSQVQPAGTPIIKTEFPATDTRGADYRTMENMFKESVTKFQPGKEVTKFILQLENVFKVCVTEENKLEENFCRMITSKMSTEYTTNFLNLPAADRKKFDKIKAHLKSTYQTQETIYQTMSHVWDIQQQPGEDIHSLGVRMEEKCLEIHNQIQPKIIGIAGRTPAQFDSKDAFLLMGSMLMVQHIRMKEPEAFRLMVRDIDDAVKPSEVSLRAKSYIDKIGQGEPAGILSENNGTFLANKEDRKKSDCKTWKSTGSCRYGKKCHYRHLECYKRGSPEAKPQPSNSNVEQMEQNPQSNTQAEKEERDAGKKPEQNKYPGQYFAYPPYFPGQLWHPYHNNRQNMENQNGQSYHVGNNIEGSEDTEYVNFGGRVLTREDFENIGYENCGPEMFEKMHFCDSVPDFQEY